MNNNMVNFSGAGFYGMDTEKARKVMERIQGDKERIVSDIRRFTSILKEEKLPKAFAGTQTTSMQDFVEKLNIVLQDFFKILDGSDSNFAKKLLDVAKSYEESDENVSKSFSNITLE